MNKIILKLALVATLAFGFGATSSMVYAREAKNGTTQGLKNGTKNGAARGLKDGLKNGAKHGLKNGLKNGAKNSTAKGLKNGKRNGEKR